MLLKTIGYIRKMQRLTLLIDIDTKKVLNLNLNLSLCNRLIIHYRCQFFTKFKYYKSSECKYLGLESCYKHEKWGQVLLGISAA